MLAFITTLRHPQNSVDYMRVEALLKGTLRSIAQQTAEEFVIIVVGNKKPNFALPPKTHFVPVDFPAPAPPTGAQTAREPFVWDKGTKLGIGLVAARQHSPTHVMIFDADDFVHRELAATIRRNPTCAGWVIREGWMYSSARNVYKPQPDFNRTCGTSFVIPLDAYGIPDTLSVTATQHEVAAAFGDRLSAIMGAHRNAEAWFRENGRVLETIPFRAAIYHVDTGENHSGKALEGLARPLSAAVQRDFAVEPTRSASQTAWAAFGPKAWVEEFARKGRRIRSRLRIATSRRP